MIIIRYWISDYYWIAISVNLKSERFQVILLFHLNYPPLLPYFSYTDKVTQCSLHEHTLSTK